MKFTNAQIVGADTDPNYYHAFGERQRGGDDFCMSRGELMRFSENPLKWSLGLASEETDSQEWGSLIDTLVLQPQRFDSLYVIQPASYVHEKDGEKPWNNNANVCRAWNEAQKDKTIIKKSERDRTDAALLQYGLHEPIRNLLAVSERQVMVTAEYHEPETGICVPLKAILDLVPDKRSARWGKSLADLKTALSVRPDLFEKSVWKCHYDAQAAFYMDLYCAATGEDRTDWLFVAQENSAPYLLADPMPMLGEDFIEIGRSKIAFALKYYCRCLKEKKWPSYSIGQRLNLGHSYRLEPRDYMVLEAAERPILTPSTHNLKRMTDI